jgi:hypothetical protein
MKKIFLLAFMTLATPFGMSAADSIRSIEEYEENPKAIIYDSMMFDTIELHNGMSAEYDRTQGLVNSLTPSANENLDRILIGLGLLQFSGVSNVEMIENMSARLIGKDGAWETFLQIVNSCVDEEAVAPEARVTVIRRI